MRSMAYSLLWVVQDLYHQPYPSRKDATRSDRTDGPQLEKSDVPEIPNPLTHPKP